MATGRTDELEQLAAVARGFDRLAAGYDHAYPRSRALALMREAALTAWRRAARPGERWLELGCGTGRDAVAMARDGVHVTAADISPGMLARVRARLRGVALRGRVVPARLGTADLPRLLPRRAGAFDGAALLFGALDYDPAPACVPPALWRLTRPGARVVLAVRNRWCPWEVATSLLVHPSWRLAFRRFARGGAETDLAGVRVRMRVFTARGLARLFAPWFTVEAWRGLSVALPPYMLAGFSRRLPRLERALAALEPVAGRLPGLRALGDHLLMTLVRRGDTR